MTRINVHTYTSVHKSRSLSLKESSRLSSFKNVVRCHITLLTEDLLYNLCIQLQFARTATLDLVDYALYICDCVI